MSLPNDVAGDNEKSCCCQGTLSDEISSVVSFVGHTNRFGLFLKNKKKNDSEPMR